MKKTLLLAIIGIVILSGIGAGAVSHEQADTNGIGDGQGVMALVDDELDQHQTTYEINWYVGRQIGLLWALSSEPLILPPPLNFSVAQSFVPTKEILTRVQLYIGKNVTAAFPYILAIRDDLMGDNIAVAAADPADVPEVLPNLSWVEFVFDNVRLIVGHTYYLVSYTANVTDNYYIWGSTDNNLYPNGTMFISVDDGKTWGDISMVDMCFKTYGKDDEPPSVEIVNPAEGYFHFSGIKLVQTPFDLIGDTMGFGGFRIRPVRILAEDDIDDSEDLLVKIYIDDVLQSTGMYNVDNGYHEWQWIGPGLGTFTLKVTAEDRGGNVGTVELDVWYFCFIPEVNV